MDHFTPLAAISGGLLIGIATALYLWLTGRYAGLSGILRSVAFGDPDRRMDTLFTIGLVLGGGEWFAFGSHPPSAASKTNLGLVVLAGVLVGFGTALGNGCTSGHGVCGLGRMSMRSFVAVLAFMITGVATVFVTHHLIGLG